MIKQHYEPSLALVTGDVELLMQPSGYWMMTPGICS